jgi:hypothetical protein
MQNEKSGNGNNRADDEESPADRRQESKGISLLWAHGRHET